MHAVTGIHEADGPIADLAVGVLSRANRYALVTWVPGLFPGADPVVLAGSTEHDVRPVASAAFGLAVALATGTHDPLIVGRPAEHALSVAVRLVEGVARSHVSNGGTWGGPSQYPPSQAHGWQTALWAYHAGAAGWLLWDHLGQDARTDVVTMVTHEADRMIGRTLPYWRDLAGVELRPGDSASEELAWDASVVALALLLCPDSTQAPAWVDVLLRMSVAAHAAPQDATSPRLMHGEPLSSWVGGSNVTADGLVVNHGIVHPDYMAAAMASLWTVPSLWAAADVPVPAAVVHGLPLVYAALTDVQHEAGPIYRPDGTIHYPQGADWGAARRMDKAALDVVAWRYGWGGPQAHEWARLHLTEAAVQQSRSTTGQTYLAPDEDTYPGREQWVAQHAAACVLALCTTPRMTALPAGDLVDLVRAEQEEPDVPVAPWWPLTPDTNWLANSHLPTGQVVGGVAAVLPGRLQRVYNPASLTAGVQTKVGAFPAALRPARTQIFGGGVVFYGSTTPVPCTVRVNPDGSLIVIPHASGTIAAGGGSSYLCIPPMGWAVA